MEEVLIVVANRNWVTNGNLSEFMIDFGYSGVGSMPYAVRPRTSGCRVLGYEVRSGT